MSNSTLWWLLAGAAVALELMSGTVYLLLIGLGFAAAALTTHLGAGLTAQLLAAAVVSVAGVLLWNLLRKRPSASSARAAGIDNLDIGAIVDVHTWNPDRTSVTRYRGAQWTVIAHARTPTEPGEYRVVDVKGSRLVVEKA